MADFAGGTGPTAMAARADPPDAARAQSLKFVVVRPVAVVRSVWSDCVLVVLVPPERVAVGPVPIREQDHLNLVQAEAVLERCPSGHDLAVLARVLDPV